MADNADDVKLTAVAYLRVSTDAQAEAEGLDRRGHEFRYRLAAGFLDPSDHVLDAACGTGYGADILQDRGGVTYLGVDRDLAEVEVRPRIGRRFAQADLAAPWASPEPFDVFVGFETMEHLADWSAWVDLARQARKWILVSVPVMPTRETNPFHLHDFEPGEIVHYFQGGPWSLYQAVGQPAELAEVYVFERAR